MRDLAAHPELLSINTATVRERWNLEEIIEGCARHGIRAISPWRDQVEAVGLEATRAAVKRHGLKLSGYCRGSMFPADATKRQEARDDNRRAVDEAATLDAACLVLVVGGLPHTSRPGSAVSHDIALARTQVEDGISELLDYARSVGMPLAIEPLHPMYAADRACVNTLAQALDICDRLDAKKTGALGVALDVYHVWWDPDLYAGIRRAGLARLLAFHVCDWLVPTRDLLLDRGMMGDGVIEIRKIRKAVEAEGFAGFSEVEIFSELDWWTRPMDEVLSTCIARHKTAV
jgi:sugar phosphate isomerase/epimerase